MYLMHPFIMTITISMFKCPTHYNYPTMIQQHVIHDHHFCEVYEETAVLISSSRFFQKDPTSDTVENVFS